MLTIVFDFRTLTRPEQFYQQLVSQTRCPFVFGNNLDALWDWLTGGMALPACLELNHLQQISPALAPLLPVIREAAEELEGLLELRSDGKPLAPHQLTEDAE